MHKLGHFEEALSSYDKAIFIKSDHAHAHNNRGAIMHKLGHFEEALSSYDRAIYLSPYFVDAHNNRGLTLKALDRKVEALSSFDQAILLDPDLAEAHNNRANLLSTLGHLEESLAAYNQAININRNYAEAYSNRGSLLKALGKFEEAFIDLKKAIYLNPNLSEAHWNISLLHLLRGNFIDGWKGYEWRWKCEDVSKKHTRKFAQPTWLGLDPLENKTILLYSEQGFGDTLQFYRYVPLVAALGAKVILQVPLPLINLFNKLDNSVQVISYEDPLPSFDYQCPLMSLPLAFATELDTIPPVLRIITSKDKLNLWKDKLGKKRKPRIGIVWSGNIEHKNDLNRSISLSRLMQYLPPDYEYISLQREIRDADKDAIVEYSSLKHFGKEIVDFTDTAALCELVDLVISVDTSVAHLAGSLCKPTWIVLPHNPDWRWLINREDSPWYQSVKLYRQDKVADWDSILYKVKFDLENHIIKLND
jgi:tetratricopeptide (TPR) repeat protein